METIKEMENDKRLLEQKYEEVNRLNIELSYKVKQLMAIQETGKAILSVLDLDQLLTVIMNILSNVCQIKRAIIMLVNEEKGCLEYKHGIGFRGDVPEEISNYSVPLQRVSNILARVTSTGKPEYVSNVSGSSLRKDNIILSHGRPTSVYVVPLITRSKVIGIIATDGSDHTGVPKETRETLEVFGPQVAIAIENARLYTKLQAQMEELKRSHALLSRAEKFSFLGNLSARLAHEIKNPLTSIGTFIRMLPKKFDDEEFGNDFYQIAMEETSRVTNLINELLELVKAKKPLFEFSDIHELIDKMILLVSPQSKSKRIEVRRLFDNEIGLIWIDQEKIKQVILNLLSNAIDFTGEGGKIEVQTARVNGKGNSENIRIWLRDTGSGIRAEMIDKIFDPYFTTKHKSDIHNGTGLGLFIAHQNIQDHGGTIEVRSKPDEGTTFIITLPFNPSKKEGEL
jgi:signal transduction histidine kinase